MTRKADFNAEEWTKVVNGPVYAGMRIIAADRGGTLRETMAMSRVYEEARKNQGASAFLDELVTSPPSLQPQQEGGDIATATVRHLNDAMRILEAKATPQEIDAYKTFVMTVAQTVASAHKEGGFLGIGGKEISEAEDQALDEISAALGAPPANAS